MNGESLKKAWALLFAIANILKREQRVLHVILFGDNGQLAEFSMIDAKDSAGLLKFLAQSFNGGTDFKTPLKCSLEIIEAQKDFIKVDILMLSDGDCTVSADFLAKWTLHKERLNCMVYSVLCNGQRVKDEFSNKIIVL